MLWKRPAKHENIATENYVFEETRFKVPIGSKNTGHN